MQLLNQEDCAFLIFIDMAQFPPPKVCLQFTRILFTHILSNAVGCPHILSLPASSVKNHYLSVVFFFFLSVVLIFIYLTLSEVGHLFVCLRTTYIPLLVNSILIVFAYFSIGLVIFFSLCIREISPLFY